MLNESLRLRTNRGQDFILGEAKPGRGVQESLPLFLGELSILDGACEEPPHQTFGFILEICAHQLAHIGAECRGHVLEALDLSSIRNAIRNRCGENRSELRCTLTTFDRASLLF